jgi:hypothetical protein
MARFIVMWEQKLASLSAHWQVKGEYLSLLLMLVLDASSFVSYIRQYEHHDVRLQV